MTMLNLEQFSTNTDKIYTECENGINNLDKIIVSISSTHTSMARCYLFPILYAYWERFFKIVIFEFFSCIELNKLNLKTINSNIAKYALKKHLTSKFKAIKIDRLQEISSKMEINDAYNFLIEIAKLFDDPIIFDSAIKWIETGSNVNFNIIEDNLSNIGIHISNLKKHFSNTKYVIHNEIKNFVDTRNEIAHGEKFNDINSNDWNKYKGLILSLMNALQLELLEMLSDDSKILKLP